MAFTKVAPAGIGSTPGDGYRIGDSFLHSTGVEITNINATGILTATSLDISGSIDVDGHTELDNINVAGVSTFNDDVNVIQGKKINFGNTNGTQGHIYFDGSTTRLQTNHGLNIGSPVCVFKSANLAETMVEAIHNGAVKLFYDQSNHSTPKIQTTATGVTIDGTAVAGALDISGNIDVDGHTNLDNVSIAGIVTATDSSYHQYYALGTSTVGGIRFGNNTHTNGYIYYDNGANMNFHAGGSERLRITDDGFIGINETQPYTGLTIEKLGDYMNADGNTYWMPEGKWSSVWVDVDAVVNGNDYWVGFGGGYHQSSSSVNISLAPNRGNLNAQQGMYISGEATGNSTSDVAVGKILGGSTTGRGTSGNVRATKSELFRISNTGRVGINTNVPLSGTHISDGTPYGAPQNASRKATLTISAGSEASADIQLLSANYNHIFFGDSADPNTGIIHYNHTGSNTDSMNFVTAGEQRLRIDSDGNVLVGTTDTTIYNNGDSASEGIVLRGGDVIDIARKGDLQLTLNRQTNDGPHIGFYRSGGVKSFISTRTNDFCIDVNSTNERLRIKANGDVQIGTAVNAGNALRYLDVANYNTGSSAGSILRLLTTKSDGSSSVGLDIVKYKSGGAYLVNYETVGTDTGFIALSTGQNGASPAVRFRVAGNGETIITPTNGGASNNRTSIHFNNAAHTPFIAFKSNNVTEAAYIKAGESSGGCDLEFQTKNTSGTLLSRLTLKNNGEIVTHQLAGNEKGYPLVMGTGTVSSNTNMSGSLNMHDINGVNTGGGNNYHIGGWVYLGSDQAAAPYPVRRFKIFKPGAFSNGTIVYQVWHDGDSNYFYGGLWEIRLNLWTDGDIEGVSLRCVNGYRDDLRVFAYNDDNGIMIQPSSIWGRIFIRRFGWDDNGRNPGSSHCAVANNGALAIYNSSGTDDGTIPTSGSPVELYSFDGTSGSASSTHTGGYNIESASYFDG